MNKTFIGANEYGFADEKAVLDMCRKVDYGNAEKWAGGSGINVISNGKESYIQDTEASTLVVGATGSGKTRRLLLPYTYSCIKDGASLVINDPKGEIYTHMYDVLREEGYNIKVLDYRNPLRGERYNPLEYPAHLYKEGNTSRAAELFTEIGKTIFEAVKSGKDPFWHLTANQYFVGLAEFSSDKFDEKLTTLNNIYNLHIQGGEDVELGEGSWVRNKGKKMRIYFSDSERKKMGYWKLLCPTVNAPNDTRGGIEAVFTSVLSEFVLNENLVDQTSDSTFDMEELIEKKTALFFITRDEGTVYDRLISTVINQVYQYLIDRAEENFENGRLDRRVEFIIDEFGNLPAINMIERKLTAGRSRNIRWLIVIQSLQQLTHIYGDDVAKIILGNGAGNLVYMYSNDRELLKYISDLCGNCKNSYGVLSDPLLPISKLRGFDKEKGETLLLLERLAPFVSYLPDISEYPIHLSDKGSIVFRDKHEIEDVDFDDLLVDVLKPSQDNEDMDSENKSAIPGEYDLFDVDNIDKMIADIDRKIAELEAEEAAEKAKEEERKRAEANDEEIEKDDE